MPGSASLTAFFVLILAATCINASVCQSNSNCFGGRCLNGQCICNAVCGQTSAILPLCGNDGQYYFSYCHLMMQSCERGLQIGIRDNRIGLNQHCDGDKRAKFAGAFWASHIRNKICPKNSCLNFGVCVIDSENLPSCLCPDGYVGPRCEAKASLISNKAYAAMRPLARVGQPSKEIYDSETAILLSLCALSAMCSAIVTSALCHRIKSQRLKKQYTRAIKMRDMEFFKTLPLEAKYLELETKEDLINFKPASQTSRFFVKSIN